MNEQHLYSTCMPLTACVFLVYQEAVLEDTPFDMAIDINIDFTHLRFVHYNAPPGRAPQMEGTLRKFEKDLDGIEGAMVAEFLGTHGRSGGRIHFMPPCTVMTETFFEKPEFKPFPLVLVFNFVPHSPTRTKVMLQIYRDFLHQVRKSQFQFPTKKTSPVCFL